MKGFVKFFNEMKGFGFVVSEDGKEIFVHQTSLGDGVSLNENDNVSFDVKAGDRGPKAVNVGKYSGELEKELEKLKQELKEELDKETEAEQPDEQIEEESENKTNNAQCFIKIIKETSLQLAKKIASAPSLLMELEWRDVERMVAVVLEELGFAVTLTPGAKDGGKDIIAELQIDGYRKVFYIEVKHWKNKPVPEKQIEHFVEIIIRDGVDQGVLLATSGYTVGAFKALSKFKKVKLHLGDRSHIYTLCRTFVSHNDGLWNKPEDLSVVLTNRH